MLNNNQQPLRCKLINPETGVCCGIGLILGFAPGSPKNGKDTTLAIVYVEQTFLDTQFTGLITIPLDRVRLLPTQEEAQAMGSNIEQKQQITCLTIPKVEYWDLKNKVAYFERENCKLEKDNQSLIQSHNREQDIKEKQRKEIISLKDRLLIANNNLMDANNKFLQTFKELDETKNQLFQANLEIKARISSEGYKEQKVINLQIKLGNLEAEKKVQSDKHAQVLMDLDKTRYELHQVSNRQHILRKELEVALSRDEFLSAFM